jgi:protein-S-isoprenylcysteine O-methyltransferase Ste14
MTWLDWIRYGIAWLLLVTGPGSVLFWFAVHPFANFWRRVGLAWAYFAGFGVFTVSAIVLAMVADTLTAVDFGGSVVTAACGLAVLVPAVSLRRLWRRHLSVRTLFGVAELSAGGPGTLLTDGIYARVRHPRYLEVLLGCLANALIANYLIAYAVAAFMAVSIAILIPVEERELRARFGEPYEAYRRRVPAIIPRFRRS